MSLFEIIICCCFPKKLWHIVLPMQPWRCVRRRGRRIDVTTSSKHATLLGRRAEASGGTFDGVGPPWKASAERPWAMDAKSGCATCATSASANKCCRDTNLYVTRFNHPNQTTHINPLISIYDMFGGYDRGHDRCDAVMELDVVGGDPLVLPRGANTMSSLNVS